MRGVYEMKKFLSLCLVVVMMTGLISITTGCKDERRRLYVFNCGDYIGEDVIEEFEDKYPNIKVVYDVFDSNEAMYSKLVNSGTAYDVIIPSDYMIERLIKEDRLNQLDMSKISNFNLISDEFKGNSFDPDNKYSVAYMWGTLGILYNKSLVTEEVTSWDILFDEKYSGQVLMQDSMRDAMCVALSRLGYSINTKNAAEIEAARDMLIAQKPLVAMYGVDTIKDPMINGSYALSVAWSGDAFWMQMENEDLEYVIPEEGSNVWIDSMVIPKTSKNTDDAYLFIDFMCSTEIAVENAEYICYSTAQKEAFAQLAYEDGSLWSENEIYNPSEETLDRCVTFIDLGDAQSLYQSAWEKIRLE